MLLPGYRRLARRNSQIAFGNEKAIRRCVAWRANISGGSEPTCFAASSSVAMPLEKIARRIDVENVDEVHRNCALRRPVVLLLSHLGQLGIQRATVPAISVTSAPARSIRGYGNRYIDRPCSAHAARTGVELFDRSEGFQSAIELLRGGGVIGILATNTPAIMDCGRHSSVGSLRPRRSRRYWRSAPAPRVIAAAIYTEGRGPLAYRFHRRASSHRRFDRNADHGEGERVISNNRFGVAPEDWFWVHNRWKTPKPNFLLTHYKRGVYVPPERSRLKPFRILIRAPNWLGDSVISMPAVRAIKAGRPDAHVTVAAPEKIAPVWKLVPEVDEVIRFRRNRCSAPSES